MSDDTEVHSVARFPALADLAEAVVALAYAIENGGVLPPGIDEKMALIIARHRVPRPVDPYEYRTTDGPRKAWDGEPDMSKEGWEEVGEWERFDYHEERHWRRLRTPSVKP